MFEELSNAICIKKFPYGSQDHFVFWGVIKNDSLNLEKISNHFLNQSEMNYLKTLKYPKKRIQFLRGRLLSKYLIAKKENLTNLRDIIIKRSVSGFPVVISQKDTALTLSHTKELSIALCFSPLYPLAIDIEKNALDSSELIKPLLSVHELSFINNKSLKDQNRVSTMLWTAKEALSKFLNCGLSAKYDVFEVDEVTSNSNHIFQLSFLNFNHVQCVSSYDDTNVLSLVSLQNVGDILQEIIQDRSF